MLRAKAANENTGRITYAQNLNDATFDRSYDYDHVGRLIEARTGSEARGHLIGQGGTQDGPYAQSYRYDQMGNMWYRVGWGGWFNPWLEQWPSYVNNRLTTNPWTGTAMTYDNAGNLTNDGYQSYMYDATGQQTSASATALTQSYDGDRLRVKKVEGTATTYYLRSSVLGGQVVSELNSSGLLQRGYVYLGSELLALQQSNQVSWVHQDPITKSQRITNSSGTVTSTIDLDPWGGETARSSNQAFQPHRFTSYERDGNNGDEAMMRRYTGKWDRFVQPDPYDGSYDLTNPQSFNRYAYVQNDPVNFVDPTGLLDVIVTNVWACGPYSACFGGPPSVPPPRFAITDRNARVGPDRPDPQNPLPGAIDAARDALKDPKSPCAKLFSKGNGLEKLNELVKKNKITIGDTGIPKALSPTGKLSGAPGIGAYAKDGKIFLNPASSIVKGTVNPGTLVFGGMSAADALATLIIHELLHVTKDLPGESLARYRDESLLNSQDVKTACFPTYNP